MNHPRVMPASRRSTSRHPRGALYDFGVAITRIVGPLPEYALRGRRMQ